jgi:osmotically-inducible protein OsmY
MKTDAQLKTDVINELQWDPAINPTNVGVAVSNGVVTLTGHLTTFAEKFDSLAERAAAQGAAWAAPGITSVVNKLAVGPHS